MAGAVVGGSHRRAHTARHPWRELAFLAAGLCCYLAVRWSTLDHRALAVANARRVLSWQQAVGLDWEVAAQAWADHHPWAGFVLLHVYVWGYLPVLAAALLWLYRRHPDAYRRLRTALLWSGGAGLVVYAAFPCAPPRLTPLGYADPVAAHDLDAVARPVGLANELAAMPSFHCGWLFLAAVVALPLVRSPVLRVLVVLHPLLMGWAVVATGNHWVLDIPAGLLVAALGLAATRVVHGPRPGLPQAPRTG